MQTFQKKTLYISLEEIHLGWEWTETGLFDYMTLYENNV
jgi:hypothetical protein